MTLGFCSPLLAHNGHSCLTYAGIALSHLQCVYTTQVLFAVTCSIKQGARRKMPHTHIVLERKEHRSTAHKRVRKRHTVVQGKEPTATPHKPHTAKLMHTSEGRWCRSGPEASPMREEYLATAPCSTNSPFAWYGRVVPLNVNASLNECGL